MSLAPTRRAIARSSARRYVSAALAALLSVAFLTATMMTIQLLNNSLAQSVASDARGADIVAEIQDVDRPWSEDAAAAVRAQDGVETVWERPGTGVLPTGTGTQTYLGIETLPPEEAMDSTVLLDGELPDAPGEATLTEAVADNLGVSPGDTFEVGTFAEEKGTTSWTITGLTTTENAENGLAESPQLLVTDAGWKSAFPDWADSVSTVAIGMESAATEADAEAVQAALDEAGTGATTWTHDAYVEQQVAELTGQSAMLTALAAAFGGVALIVAGLVITTTFSVVVVQRTRQLALLRLSGATRGQVRSIVLGEALGVGAGGSALGVAAGVGLVQLVAVADRVLDLGLPIVGSGITVSALVVPFLVGTVVTVVAGFGPARAATRVAPIAALRPAQAPGRAARGPVLRLVAGLLALVGGAAMLVLGTWMNVASGVDNLTLGLLLAMAGGALSLIGLLVAAPWLLSPAAAGLGSLLGRVIPPMRHAGRNVARTPRRTGSTLAALIIGTVLVSLMSTGATTAQRTLDEELAARAPVDLTSVTSLSPQDAESAVADVTGIDGAYGTRVLELSLAGPESGDAPAETVDVVAVDPAAVDEVAHRAGMAEGAEDGSVLLPESLLEHLGVADGEPVIASALAPDGSTSTPATELTAADNDRVTTAMVTPATFDRLVSELPGATPSTYVMADVADAGAESRADTTAAEITQEVSTALSTEDGLAEVSAPFAEREMIGQVISMMLTFVLALLGVAVLIAVIGVANTLSLSTIERTHENALLRALGASRSQLRAMLTAEGVLLGIVGGVVGAVLGTVYGAAGAAVLLGPVGTVSVGIPWSILAAVVVVSALAGALAAAVPARRALRVQPVEALAEVA